MSGAPRCYALQYKSSSGFDCISTKLLRCVIDLLVYPLEHIFNLSFRSGVYSDLLKIAKVVPIYKGSEQSNLINYRPVSVLPAVSKILERLTYNRMITYIDKFSLVTKWQFGFKPRRST
jgi:hypothetical protein